MVMVELDGWPALVACCVTRSPTLAIVIHWPLFFTFPKSSMYINHPTQTHCFVVGGCRLLHVRRVGKAQRQGAKGSHWIGDLTE